MDKELLSNYIDQDYSLSEICAATNRGNGTICYWLKKYGLKTHHKRGDVSKNALWRARPNRVRRHSPSKQRKTSTKKNVHLNQIDWKHIQDLYDSGFNYIQTAKQGSISVSVLRRGVKSGFLKPRSASESLRIYRKTHPSPPLS